MGRDGECVGFVKSAAYGFTVGKQIAYGYVDAPNGSPMKPKQFTEWLSAGEWHIGDKGCQRPAILHLKSVFDSGNSRVKGEYPPEVTSLADMINIVQPDEHEASVRATV